MKGLSYQDARRVGRMSAIVACFAVIFAITWCLRGYADSPASSTKTLESIPVSVGSSDAILSGSKSRVYEQHLDSMPPIATVRLKYENVGALGKVFNDSNYLHLDAADAVGISPITSLAGSWQLRRPLVKVESCKEYFIDNLTHSEPYLVPEAQLLLADIGRQFNDAVQTRGGGGYRLKVTSVLRTPDSIKRLRRRNGNAIDMSAHQFGTTFDISYSNFICDNDATPCSIDDLKGVLAEVLNGLRDQGRCYVKYERKQSCFHITVRPYNA